MTAGRGCQFYPRGGLGTLARRAVVREKRRDYSGEALIIVFRSRGKVAWTQGPVTENRNRHVGTLSAL